jgi:hypothetical protein
MIWCRRALLMALVTLSVLVPWLFIDSQSSSTSSYDSGTPIFFTHPCTRYSILLHTRIITFSRNMYVYPTTTTSTTARLSLRRQKKRTCVL